VISDLDEIELKKADLPNLRFFSQKRGESLFEARHTARRQESLALYERAVPSIFLLDETGGLPRSETYLAGTMSEGKKS
jgi:hypothetical protein